MAPDRRRQQLDQACRTTADWAIREQVRTLQQSVGALRQSLDARGRAIYSLRLLSPPGHTAAWLARYGLWRRPRPRRPDASVRQPNPGRGTPAMPQATVDEKFNLSTDNVAQDLNYSGRSRKHRGTGRAFGSFGRCGRRAERFDTNLRRCVRPERATNIVLSAVVDQTPAFSRHENAIAKEPGACYTPIWQGAPHRDHRRRDPLRKHLSAR
jgi:hypothetical protein